MKLRVLVIGLDNRQFDDPSEQPHAFKFFCEGLGAALAKKGHQIVVLSDNEKYADKFVLQGYLKEKDRKLPPVISYRDPRSETATKFEDLRNRSTFEDIYTSDAHPFNRIGAVNDVDAIVVVGGHKEAKAMVRIGATLRKPIIPIKQFGGEAGEKMDNP